MAKTTTDTATEKSQAPPQMLLTHESLATEGTRYTPTLVSVEAGAFIEDACPMSYDIEDSQTWIVLGDTNTVVNLQLSDRALINLATMTNRAAHALLHERGKVISGTDNGAT